MVRCREAAEAGLGLALLPRFIMEQGIAAGRLIPVLSSVTPAGLALNALYPQHRQHSPVIRALISYIAEHLAVGASADLTLY